LGDPWSRPATSRRVRRYYSAPIHDFQRLHLLIPWRENCLLARVESTFQQPFRGGGFTADYRRGGWTRAGGPACSPPAAVSGWRCRTPMPPRRAGWSLAQLEQGGAHPPGRRQGEPPMFRHYALRPCRAECDCQRGCAGRAVAGGAGGSRAPRLYAGRPAPGPCCHRVDLVVVEEQGSLVIAAGRQGRLCPSRMCSRGGAPMPNALAEGIPRTHAPRPGRSARLRQHLRRQLDWPVGDGFGLADLRRAGRHAGAGGGW